jgi:hypothetical protein
MIEKNEIDGLIDEGTLDWEFQSESELYYKWHSGLDWILQVSKDEQRIGFIRVESGEPSEYLPFEYEGDSSDAAKYIALYLLNPSDVYDHMVEEYGEDNIISISESEYMAEADFGR